MASNSPPTTSDWEIRRALILTCSDALANTEPLTPGAVERIREVLRRLIRTETITSEEEGRWITHLLMECDLNPPFEGTIMGQMKR